MRNARFAVFVLLIFFVATFTAAKPKGSLTVSVCLDGRTVLSQTFSPSKDLPLSKRAFGFDSGRYFSKLRKQGLDDKEIILKVYPELAKTVDVLVEQEYIPSVDASVSFYPGRAEKFVYAKERTGSRIDADKLYKDIVEGVRKKSVCVTAERIILRPKITENTLRKNTVKRGTFSTSIADSSADRKNNIERAVSFINGTRVLSGEIFSFNKVVGARTVERGYKEAPIIVDGSFVGGVGGGVCQVSTTLYNAVLYSNLAVKSVSRHSLPVRYVKPSFDAMVSSVSDFRFMNDTSFDVFIWATCKEGRLSFTLYGAPNDAEIRLESVTVKCIPYVVKYVDDDTLSIGEEKVLFEGADGLESKGYMTVSENGVTEKREIRRDVYAPRARLVARGTKEINDEKGGTA